MSPIIDILIITYNQEKSISKAIESILNQQHNFSYRINIADDFSTDQTREILKKFKEKYPKIINLILSPKNQGSKNNFINGLKFLTGKYIACLDGDDYYCSDKKLQKQIFFLEQNPDFTGSAHNVLVVTNNEKEVKFKNKMRDVYTIQDFLDGSISFNSSSIIFRNIFQGNFPKSQENPDAEDLFFTMLHAKHGKIKYFDEVMSVYNLHGSGEWSSLSEEEKIKKTIKIFNFAQSVFDEKKYKKYAKCGIKRERKNLYKRVIRKQKRNILQKLVDYIKFRYLCYSLKIYDLIKTYEIR